MGAEMIQSFVVIAGAIALFSQAQASDQKPWDDSFRPLKGEYLIYSVTLNESQQPTRNDRKVSFKVTGQVAKDLFDSMYPDEKNTCTNMKGYRERRKREVFCTYDPQDGYACYFGFDLRSGKSVGGASC
jgi:hypothetical protein